jgi:hypothetical protein
MFSRRVSSQDTSEPVAMKLVDLPVDLREALPIYPADWAALRLASRTMRDAFAVPQAVRTKSWQRVVAESTDWVELNRAADALSKAGHLDLAPTLKALATRPAAAFSQAARPIRQANPLLAEATSLDPASPSHLLHPSARAVAGLGGLLHDCGHLLKVLAEHELHPQPSLKPADQTMLRRLFHRPLGFDLSRELPPIATAYRLILRLLEARGSLCRDLLTVSDTSPNLAARHAAIQVLLKRRRYAQLNDIFSRAIAVLTSEEASSVPAFEEAFDKLDRFATLRPEHREFTDKVIAHLAFIPSARREAASRSVSMSQGAELKNDQLEAAFFCCFQDQPIIDRNRFKLAEKIIMANPSSHTDHEEQILMSFETMMRTHLSASGAAPRKEEVASCRSKIASTTHRTRIAEECLLFFLDRPEYVIMQDVYALLDRLVGHQAKAIPQLNLCSVLSLIILQLRMRRPCDAAVLERRLRKPLTEKRQGCRQEHVLFMLRRLATVHDIELLTDAILRPDSAPWVETCFYSLDRIYLASPAAAEQIDRRMEALLLSHHHVPRAGINICRWMKQHPQRVSVDAILNFLRKKNTQPIVAAALTEVLQEKIYLCMLSRGGQVA